MTTTLKQPAERATRSSGSSPGAIDVRAPHEPSAAATRAAVRACRFGLVLIGLGLIAIAHGGLALVAIGALLCAPRAYRMYAESTHRRDDHAAAEAFSRRLASSGLPAVVEAAILRSEGRDLDPDEVCYVDGAPVEILSFYGEPYVKHSLWAVFLGGPLAWIATIVAWLFVMEANKRRAKRAKPRWRDPEHVRVWVTSRRLVFHGMTGRRSWAQLAYEHLIQVDPENGGLVLSATEGPQPLMKVRLAYPSSLRVLIERLVADTPCGRGYR
jgi:hypothetical protein